MSDLIPRSTMVDVRLQLRRIEMTGVGAGDCIFLTGRPFRTHLCFSGRSSEANGRTGSAILLIPLVGRVLMDVSLSTLLLRVLRCRLGLLLLRVRVGMIARALRAAVCRGDRRHVALAHETSWEVGLRMPTG